MMKAREVSPALIGRRLRLEADTVRIEGQLQDLGVLTETIQDDPLIYDAAGPDPMHGHVYLSGVILNISGHELRLHGNETVTILEGDQ